MEPEKTKLEIGDRAVVYNTASNLDGIGVTLIGTYYRFGDTTTFIVGVKEPFEDGATAFAITEHCLARIVEED